MKKFLFLLLLMSLPLGFVECIEENSLGTCEGLTITISELENVEASVSVVNNSPRLNLTLDVAVTQEIISQKLPLSLPFIHRAYACTMSGGGLTLETWIKEISLTCNKPIRVFNAGENIMTTRAEVYHPDYYYSNLSLGKWINAVNYHKEGGYYDVSIAFLPEGTDVPAGDYTFTFSMTLRGGTTFNRTFDPITII